MRKLSTPLAIGVAAATILVTSVTASGQTSSASESGSGSVSLSGWNLSLPVDSSGGTSGDGEADTLDSLGYIAHPTGEHAQAVRYYQEALTLFRTLSDTNSEATTLERLGQTHIAVGNRQQANAAWQQALTLYRDHHRPTEADRVKQRLAELQPR